MKNFLFYKEYKDGRYYVESDISMTRAKKLYKEALKDFGYDITSTGWEQLQEPLMPSQVVKLKKGGVIA